MTKKIIFGFSLLLLTYTEVSAEESEEQLGFTVTTIALDAQRKRLQLEEEVDENKTNLLGGDRKDKQTDKYAF